MKKILQSSLIIMAFCSGLLISCNGHKVDPFTDIDVGRSIDQVRENVSDASGIVGDSSESIRKDASTIKDEAQLVSEKVPVKSKPQVKPHLATIVKTSDHIIKSTIELDKANSKLGSALSELGTAEAKVKEIQDEYKRAVKETEAAIEARDKAIAREKVATKRLLNFLIIACVIAFGIGVTLMFFKHYTTGGGIAIASIATMVLAVAVVQYLEWIAIGGLIIIGLAVAYLAYQFFLRQKAIEEVVQTTEIAKRSMPEDKQKEVFGDGPDIGKAYVIQSSSTEKLVNKVRKQQRDQWEPTVRA
tara:strand:- start:1683 stop:2588 length:906 start_codon:yes stop_codon:yes gene_type:complete